MQEQGTKTPDIELRAMLDSALNRANTSGKSAIIWVNNDWGQKSLCSGLGPNEWRLENHGISLLKNGQVYSPGERLIRLIQTLREMEASGKIQGFDFGQAIIMENDKQKTLSDTIAVFVQSQGKRDQIMYDLHDIKMGKEIPSLSSGF